MSAGLERSLEQVLCCFSPVSHGLVCQLCGLMDGIAVKQGVTRDKGCVTTSATVSGKQEHGKCCLAQAHASLLCIAAAPPPHCVCLLLLLLQTKVQQWQGCCVLLRLLALMS